MQGFELILTLTEDCVFSERAATEGGHRGLDYIPGAAILGAAAAKLYSSLTPTDAFTLFHSGQVRFGNGLPLGTDNQTFWPTPLCWYKEKGEEKKASDDPCEPTRKEPHLTREQISYGSRLADKTKQPEPLSKSNKYVSKTGSVYKPLTSMRMKAAIDPTTGQAREAALFGYSSLTAGQQFIACISADDSVAPTLLGQLRTLFSGSILLGRSRSAEYGRVQVKIRDLPQMPNIEHPDCRVTLWLLSDLAALDNHGQPTLAPLPHWLGLPQGEVVPEDTFVRTRRYSPWNAYRGGPDLERQVITQGSILTFKLEQPLTTQHCDRITAGLGVQREAGLGQVWLNPDWLTAEDGHPNFSPHTPPRLPDSTPTSPEPALIKWLKKEHTGQDTRSKVTKLARDKAKEYQNILDSARKLKGLDHNIEIGPSASQWGSVLGVVKVTEAQQLKEALFNENRGVCKPSMPGWSDEYWSFDRGGRVQNFRDWCKGAFDSNPTPRFMQALAREVMDVVKGKKHRQAN